MQRFKIYKKNQFKRIYTLFQKQVSSSWYRKKNNSSVPGGLYEISKSDEKKLDIYEDYPILYKKMYFKYYNNTVMTYIMPKKTIFRYPTERYLNVVKQGYKDCKLDKKYLKKALVNF